MNNPDNRNRLNSLLVPWFSDGGLSIVFAAAPLLAKHLGAPVLILGMMGVIAQAIRLPLCLITGRLSEKYGRKQLIIPAAIIAIIGCVGLALSKSIFSVVAFFAIAVAAMGGFYPPLQAFIGDVSRPGRLAKNIGAFNVGWCVGSAVAGSLAALLLKLGYETTFAVSAGFLVISITIMLSWKKPQKQTSGQQEQQQSMVIVGNDVWLTIGRFGHFVGFFGYATIRMLYPEVGKSIGWSDSQVAAITGLLMYGLGIGIFATGISPWWRGKIWPQLLSQCLMLCSALGMAYLRNRIFVGAAFLTFGISMAICYTSAIYHGLAARSKMGRNMGIHEALVAAGQISGSLLGALAVGKLGLKAPYLILAVCAGVAAVSSVYLYTYKIIPLEANA